MRAIDGGAGVNGQQATTSRGSGIFVWANGAWAGPVFTVPASGAFLDALSCSPGGLCVAADSAGNVYIDPDVTAPPATATSPASATPTTTAECPTSAQMVAAWNAAPAATRQSWAAPGIVVTAFQGASCWNGWVVASPVSHTPGNGTFIFSLQGGLHLQPVTDLQQFDTAVCASPSAPQPWKGPTLANCQS